MNHFHSFQQIQSKLYKWHVAQSNSASLEERKHTYILMWRAQKIFHFHMIWDCRAYEQVLSAAERICDAQRCLLETCPCRVPGGQKAGRSSSTSSHGSCLVSRHLVATGLLWGMREALYVRARSYSLVPPLVCCKMPVVRTTISPPNSLMLVQGWIPRHECAHQCPLCHGKTSDIGG